MSTQRRDLSRAAKIYIAVVACAGLAALVHSAAALAVHPPTPGWLVLAGLTLLTGSLTIKVPTVSARLSVSEVFVFAAVLWFGPAVATFIVALDTLVGTLWLRGPGRSFARVVFNVSAGVAAIWVASHIFQGIAPQPGLSRPPIQDLLLPVVVLAVGYFAINSLLIAMALGFQQGASPIDIWRRNFLWLGLNHLVGASVAVLLVAYTPSLDVTAFSVIVPLLVITYLTFRMTLGRLEDANKHVSQLNELYLSTVETLAMAIDAKDQITHGHIRRVQVYTVELAKRLGVDDSAQLKGIEAAALLHDMGKLAIPEHILNKPGRLTPAEFDKMKRHADIGADLLSSIKFPYPVVPIVRHHHENWDGTGYPSGIAGTDIPIGARILSVVDCFDALTSDRPYRPRLAPSEAFTILRERRGTMYDPLVVDAFIEAHAEVAPIATLAGREARSLVNSAGPDAVDGENVALNEIRASASEAAILTECAHLLNNGTTWRRAAEIAWQALRQLTPVTTCALYRYDAASDVLTCDAAAGDPHNLLFGLQIRRGERVSGWCAANLRTAMNSDASLDLVQIATLFTPHLRSAIAVPIIENEQLIAVLSGYSIRESAFDERHRYVMERVAGLLTNRVLFNSVRPRAVTPFPGPKPS
jgi:putative nucleotidyltransferase with HDIG domain